MLLTLSHKEIHVQTSSSFSNSRFKEKPCERKRFTKCGYKPVYKVSIQTNQCVSETHLIIEQSPKTSVLFSDCVSNWQRRWLHYNPPFFSFYTTLSQSLDLNFLTLHVYYDHRGGKRILQTKARWNQHNRLVKIIKPKEITFVKYTT